MNATEEENLGPSPHLASESHVENIADDWSQQNLTEFDANKSLQCDDPISFKLHICNENIAGFNEGQMDGDSTNVDATNKLDYCENDGEVGCLPSEGSPAKCNNVITQQNNISRSLDEYEHILNCKIPFESHSDSEDSDVNIVTVEKETTRTNSDCDATSEQDYEGGVVPGERVPADDDGFPENQVSNDGEDVPCNDSFVVRETAEESGIASYETLNENNSPAAEEGFFSGRKCDQEIGVTSPDESQVEVEPSDEGQLSVESEERTNRSHSLHEGTAKTFSDASYKYDDGRSHSNAGESPSNFGFEEGEISLETNSINSDTDVSIYDNDCDSNKFDANEQVLVNVAGIEKNVEHTDEGSRASTADHSEHKASSTPDRRTANVLAASHFTFANNESNKSSISDIDDSHNTIDNSLEITNGELVSNDVTDNSYDEKNSLDTDRSSSPSRSEQPKAAKQTEKESHSMDELSIDAIDSIASVAEDKSGLQDDANSRDISMIDNHVQSSDYRNQNYSIEKSVSSEDSAMDINEVDDSANKFDIPSNDHNKDAFRSGDTLQDSGNRQTQGNHSDEDDEIYCESANLEPNKCSPDHRTEQFRLSEKDPIESDGLGQTSSLSPILGQSQNVTQSEFKPCESPSLMDVDSFDESSQKSTLEYSAVSENKETGIADLVSEVFTEPDSKADQKNGTPNLNEKGSSDKDEDDPDALTIDTGMWSGENSPKNEGKVDKGNPAPLPQVPSDFDEYDDPGALTIDIGRNKQSLIKGEPTRQCSISEGSDKSLKMHITSTFKKTPGRKVRKAKNKAGNKGIKKRIPNSSRDLKCLRCPSVSTTFSALINHQAVCAATNQQSADGTKAPRKVYMCSSCGSYYEPWNLFMHMKKMHKRHICLHCLGMFSQASKLGHHLATKHKVPDNHYLNAEEVSQVHPGSYFFLCTVCDAMFTENDFANHVCELICPFCGLSGNHYPTCRLAPTPIPTAVSAPAVPVKTQRKRGRQKGYRKHAAMAPPPTASPAASFIQTTHEVIQHQEQNQEISESLEFSPTTYNEKMMQLYKVPPKPMVYSTPESIEDSINRVLERIASPKKISSPIEPESVEREETPVDDLAPDSPVLPDASDEEEPAAEPPPPLSPSPSPMRDASPTPQPKPRRRALSDADSSDSDKLTIELNPRRRRKIEKVAELPDEDLVVVAGEETPFTCVPLPEPLDAPRVPTAMKLFLRATALTCIYCAHARKIAVNAKQLAIHQLSQHRYVTIADSSTLIEKGACHAAIVRVMRESLPSLESIFFNAYGFDSSDKTAWRSADRVYECFHCSFMTPDLREFNTHNKKLHWSDMRQKRAETHLCIMCKTRFLTYTELLCHLCRGVYVSGQIIDPNSRYRCYCCDIEPLPSSFRLMVHLRLTHTTCDMCFLVCESQAGLHAHIMKHKSLYYCYACALAYETRAELSKHIFWKHGAESATCKRCLQKKWKHAYHFCLPPPGFTCDVCKGWFKTTLALRVHSRLHTGELPHSCDQCSEKFISKKLLAKHAIVHAEAPAQPIVNGGGSACEVPSLEQAKKKSKKVKKKDLRDLFDLPPVNLSESDDSSDETPSIKDEVKLEVKETPSAGIEPLQPGSAADPALAVVWDGVLAGLQGSSGHAAYPRDSPFYNQPAHRVIAIATGDHDYCRPSATKNEAKASGDHDYCNNSANNGRNKHNSPRKQAKRRNRSSSSDSSSSSSSSCGSNCGSNCSCSSSTSSTESATSGERPSNSARDSQRKKNLIAKAERRKAKSAKREVEVEPEVNVDVGGIQGRIQESDLETDEPITDDEEFYELNPALRASQVLQLNRSILLDKLDVEPSPSLSSPSNPLRPVKKRRGRLPGSKMKPRPPRPLASTPYTPSSARLPDVEEADTPDTDGRRPRRKRVPLKFYGFSSGEEDEYTPTPPRKRERVIVEHNTTIPASPPEQQSLEPNNLWNPPSWRPPPVAPRVDPIKIRTGSLKQTFAKSNNSDEFHIKRAELGGFHVNGGNVKDKNEKLYCFCQCPYDEVSEMIACDAVDCVIEWFHFECVGIMDPPKGKWFCPDCKKKAAAENEMMGIPFR